MIVWKAQCDCGKICDVIPLRVKSGSIKSCGCNRYPRKDYTGIKFYKLTILEPTDTKKGGNIIWKAICDCGNITYISAYDAQKGHTKSCGCEMRTYHPMISSARKIWNTYKVDGISFDDFYILSQKDCFYCGCKPYSTSTLKRSSLRTSKDNGDFIYNGLDRIDSSKGHTLDNVVPCCFPCNWSKMDRTLEEFLLHIGRMYDGTRQLRKELLSLTRTPELVLPSEDE